MVGNEDGSVDGDSLGNELLLGDAEGIRLGK
jgi:hypothetical protein